MSRPFNIISVISGRWTDDDEKLCAMEIKLRSFRNWPNQNPKLILNIKGKDGQTYLTNNEITDGKPSKQLFRKQMATQLPLLN